jgi:hypothetical protein
LIAYCFFSVLNTNFLARVLYGFFSVKKTFHVVVAFEQVACARLPLHRLEAAKDIPIRVQNECQGARMAVASTVKVFSAEIIGASSLQKHKLLLAELVKEQKR